MSQLMGGEAALVWRSVGGVVDRYGRSSPPRARIQRFGGTPRSGSLPHEGRKDYACHRVRTSRAVASVTAAIRLPGPRPGGPRRPHIARSAARAIAMSARWSKVLA